MSFQMEQSLSLSPSLSANTLNSNPSEPLSLSFSLSMNRGDNFVPRGKPNIQKEKFPKCHQELWSENASAVLVDSWVKTQEHLKTRLTESAWQHNVVAKVNGRHGGLCSKKSLSQCKDRLRILKNIYKRLLTEKKTDFERSRWPHWKLLHSVLGRAGKKRKERCKKSFEDRKMERINSCGTDSDSGGKVENGTEEPPQERRLHTIHSKEGKEGKKGEESCNKRSIEDRKMETIRSRGTDSDSGGKVENDTEERPQKWRLHSIKEGHRSCKMRSFENRKMERINSRGTDSDSGGKVENGTEEPSQERRLHTILSKEGKEGKEGEGSCKKRSIEDRKIETISSRGTDSDPGGKVGNDTEESPQKWRFYSIKEGNENCKKRSIEGRNTEAINSLGTDSDSGGKVENGTEEPAPKRRFFHYTNVVFVEPVEGSRGSSVGKVGISSKINFDREVANNPKPLREDPTETSTKTAESHIPEKEQHTPKKFPTDVMDAMDSIKEHIGNDISKQGKSLEVFLKSQLEKTEMERVKDRIERVKLELEVMKNNMSRLEWKNAQVFESKARADDLEKLRLKVQLERMKETKNMGILSKMWINENQSDI